VVAIRKGIATTTWSVSNDMNTPEAAKARAQQHFDDAVRDGYDWVRIIHGCVHQEHGS
jgi:hypothetical protein